MIGPSLLVGRVPEQRWDTGFFPAYNSNLIPLAMERYVSIYLGPVISASFHFSPRITIFIFTLDTHMTTMRHSTTTVRLIHKRYLTHDAGKNIILTYLNSTKPSTSHL